jgi:hypothetical protein
VLSTLRLLMRTARVNGRLKSREAFERIKVPVAVLQVDA